MNSLARHWNNLQFLLLSHTPSSGSFPGLPVASMASVVLVDNGPLREHCSLRQGWGTHTVTASMRYSHRLTKVF